MRAPQHLMSRIGALFFSLGCLLSSGSATALAQDDAESELVPLEPVTVTAQKRGQAATAVPITLTAYTGEFLES